MRVLITGAAGFVGPHLVSSLRAAGIETIVSTAKDATHHPALGAVEALDITDAAAVDAAITRHAPDRLVHLAGIAATTAASADPAATWRVHVDGTLNIAHALMRYAPQCTLLYVGSGMVYGATANTEPEVSERSLLAPIGEYAATKAAADLALGALAPRGLKCIRLRPFNHTGPGQDETFMVPGFAMQIASIEAGEREPILRVGNLEAVRDLLDVRDVAAAYTLATLHASSLPPNLILNVASGIGRRIGDVLDRLLGLSNVEIAVEQDPGRMRAAEVEKLVGDAELAHRLLGWEPKLTLETTLADVLADCRQRVASLA